MKKIIIFLILTYLLFTINSSADNKTFGQNKKESEKFLKIGVLLPLTGESKYVGESFLKSIQLALYDISNEDIKIYTKDSKGNALGAYTAAKEFDEQGIKIVLGPIFYESLRYLEEAEDMIFLSFTNRTLNLPKNVISAGINAT